ncbi:MAG: VCBS repeat-containing protein, partial [Cytophagales bacterium]|nr:VCBS repeat-containing protein [Cytophagales bacterium]
MKKLNFLLVLFVSINLNTFAQIFTKITEGPLVNDKSDGIGCTWGDYDNDGDLDVLIAVSQPSLNNPNRRNFLYQNNCNGQFTKIIAIPGGIATDEEISNTATWVDYDNDDDLDLFVTTEFKEKNSLYRNNGDGTFSKII